MSYNMDYQTFHPKNMDNDNEYDRNVKYQNYREIVSKGAIDDHKTQQVMDKYKKIEKLRTPDRTSYDEVKQNTDYAKYKPFQFDNKQTNQKDDPLSRFNVTSSLSVDDQKYLKSGRFSVNHENIQDSVDQFKQRHNNIVTKNASGNTMTPIREEISDIHEKQKQTELNEEKIDLSKLSPQETKQLQYFESVSNKKQINNQIDLQQVLISQLKEQVELLNQQKKTDQQTIQSLKDQELNKEKRENEKIQELQEKLAEQVKANAEYQVCVENLLKKQEKLDIYQLQIKQLKEELDEAYVQNAEYKQVQGTEQGQLQDQIIQLQRDLRKQQNLNERLRPSVDVSESNELRKKLRAVEQELDETFQKNIKLRQQINESQKFMLVSQKDKQNIISQILPNIEESNIKYNLNDEKQDYNLKNMTLELAKKNEKVNELNEEIKALKSDIQSKDQQIIELLGQNNVVKVETQVLQLLNYQKQSDNIIKIQQELQITYAAKLKTEQSLKEANENIASLKLSQQQVQMVLNQKDEQINRLKDEVQVIKIDHNNSQDGLKKQIQTFREKVQNNEELLESLQSKLASYEIVIQDLGQKKTDSPSLLQSVNQEYENRLIMKQYNKYIVQCLDFYEHFQIFYLNNSLKILKQLLKF